MNIPERRGACKGDIRVEFHNDQRQLLVVGESQLAVYDGSILERLLEVIHSFVEAEFIFIPLYNLSYVDIDVVSTVRERA